MAGVRALRERVHKLEQARQDRFGWVDQFVADAEAGVAAESLDRADMSIVLASVQKWRRDRLWELWQ